MSRGLADAARAINIPQCTIRSDGERVFRSRSPRCSYADGGLPKTWKGHSLVQLAPGRAIHGLLATEVTRRPIVTDRPPALPYAATHAGPEDVTSQARRASATSKVSTIVDRAVTPFLGGCAATMTPQVDMTKRREEMTALILLRRRLSRSDSGLRRRAGSTRRGGGWKRNGGALRKKCAVAAEALPGKSWTSPAQITPGALRLKAG